MFAVRSIGRSLSGRHGAPGDAGVSLTEIRNFDLVQVMARRGKAAEMAKAAKARFGVAAPETPKAVQTSDATLIWSGPDQFFVLSKGGKHAIEALGSDVRSIRLAVRPVACARADQHLRRQGADDAGQAVVDRFASRCVPGWRGGRDLDGSHQRHALAWQ